MSRLTKFNVTRQAVMHRAHAIKGWCADNGRTAYLVEAVLGADMGRAYATRGPSYEAWLEAQERLTTHLQLVVGREMDGLLETTYDAVMAAIADGSEREMRRAGQIISSDGGKPADVARAMAALDAARATLLSAGMCA